MKKIFEKPSIIIDRFEVDDVLTTSQPGEIWYNDPEGIFNHENGGVGVEPDW